MHLEDLLCPLFVKHSVVTTQVGEGRYFLGETQRPTKPPEVTADTQGSHASPGRPHPGPAPTFRVLAPHTLSAGCLLPF